MTIKSTNLAIISFFVRIDCRRRRQRRSCSGKTHRQRSGSSHTCFLHCCIDDDTLRVVGGLLRIANFDCLGKQNHTGHPYKYQQQQQEQRSVASKQDQSKVMRERAFGNPDPGISTVLEFIVFIFSIPSTGLFVIVCVQVLAVVYLVPMVQFSLRS